MTASTGATTAASLRRRARPRARRGLCWLPSLSGWRSGCDAVAGTAPSRPAGAPNTDVRSRIAQQHLAIAPCPPYALVVLFSWLDERRRKRLLQNPFPDEWRRILSRNMLHFGYLDAGEQQRLCELVQLFVAEKEWEGCNGLVLSDEIKVTIAGQACLLVLGLDHVLYANVETILVYPSTFIPRRPEDSIFAIPGLEHPMLPLIGEAHRRGPVILTWDAVRRSGRHPELGHNVVYHEFAHKLDMLDGDADGVPPLGDKAEYERWNRVCKAEYERLRELSDAGREGVLDPYGSTDEGEFFAVVTEAFFDAPIDLAEEYPALYEVMSAFYRQDTATRQRRALALNAAPSDPH